MAKFLMIYHGGGMPETEEAQQAAMAAWDKWYTDMGKDVVVDYGAPVMQSHTVSADGHVENGGANPVSGYSIVNAETYEAACALAAKNPMVLDGSGSVEVAQMVEMG
jgi:hypothetical protein